MSTLKRTLAGPRRMLLGCLLGVVMAVPAGAAVVGVTSDTTTQLDINWGFTAADSGVTSTWTGTHWQAEMKPTWMGAGWNVQAWYLHLDGPHGEGPEFLLHNMGSVSFMAGGGGFLVMPIQDHDPPSFHGAAHSGLLTANGPGITPLIAVPEGFAREFVAHVPEPTQALLLLGGLAALALHGRRSRRL